MTTSLIAYPHAPTPEPWWLRDENARLMSERRGLTDALTALGNRRAFDQALRQEVARRAGVAALGWSDVSPDALLRRADTALYEAKRQGRNRVVSASRPAKRPRIFGLWR